MAAVTNSFLEGPSKTAVSAFALATLAIIGVLDYWSGYEISFAVFYLVPAGVAAWYSGRNAGVFFALASSLVWYAAERAAGYPYSHPAIPVWNAFVRLLFFGIIAVLLAALRERLLTARRLAKTDALTGAFNVRAFSERLEHDLALTRRFGGPLALAYIDLDDFKQVNDTYGHGEGDELLRSVARKLMENTRRSDTVVRLGGDEFALILPGTDLKGVRKLLSEFDRSMTLARSQGFSVTWSIGALVFDELPADAAAAVAAADRLMYRAKAQGKNSAAVGVYRASGTEIVDMGSTPEIVADEAAARSTA